MKIAFLRVRCANVPMREPHRHVEPLVAGQALAASATAEQLQACEGWAAVEGYAA